MKAQMREYSTFNIQRSTPKFPARRFFPSMLNVECPLAIYRSWALNVLFLFLFTFSARAVTLTTGDTVGNSSFNTAGNWSDAQPPHAGASYVVAVQFLRTPADANNYTFAGNSLTLTNGGGMIYKGTAAANTYTFSSLVLSNGGFIRSGAGSGNTMVLAGAMSVFGTNASSQILADQSPFTINAAISGTGSLLFSGGFTTTVNGTNSFTGNTSVSGAMTLGTSGVMTFKIGGNGTNNSISGAGTATFNGRFAFDVSNASTNLGHSWTIASVTTKTFAGTFSVDGFSKQGFGTGPGYWDLNTNGVYYEFNTASGVLTVVSGPSSTGSGSLAPASVKFGAVEADLLASYAASYATSVGGEDNAQVIIANTVAGGNYLNDQSGTGARMRLAGFYQSANDVTGQTTTGGIVNWLANNDSHLSDVVSYAATIGADLVVYICNNSDSASIAGVSQQPGMYSSLNPGAVWSAVFAHETGGHAYGRSHSDGFAVPDGSGNLGFPKTIMLHNYCTGGSSPPYFFSNPKIWYGGKQLQGDGNNCGQGSLINGGDNSLPGADSAQSVADRRARVITGPNLTNVVLRWLFTNAPTLVAAGTTNFDLVANAPAIVRGNGAYYTGGALRIPGGTSGNIAVNSMAAYIDLPNGIISSRTNLTIEIWATPLSAPSWARLFDFGRTTQTGDGAAGEWTGTPGSAAPGSTSSSDDIMLSAAIGTDIEQQRFEAKLNGTATTLDAALATTAGVPHHYAITFADGAGAAGSAGGRWTWFRDGDAIAYLDVSNHLAAIEDVNNWLGRSLWSDDQMANNEYTEVRISTVAMSRGEVLANYLLGPNYQPTTTVALNASDAAGASSFNAAGQWSSAGAPNAANSYETFDYLLRTPATGSAYTFGGNTLKISGGELLYASTSGSTITVTNLVLNGGAVHHSGSGTFTLAGNISVTTNGAEFNAQNGAMTVTAPISGLAPVYFIGNNTLTLSGNNSNFLGKTFLGNGWYGAVAIDSPSRLGPSPASFTSDHLTMNRGTLLTTTTMTLSNDNRGILLDVSGGTFNVASGTTLTLASTLSSPVTAANIVVGGLTKAGLGTLVLSTTNTTFKGTLFTDSGSQTTSDGVVKIVNNQALANAHSPIFIRNNNSGSSTLQLDGSAGNLTLSQGISLAARNTATVAIENFAGTNTISGGITLNVGGANYWIQSDAGSQLNLGGTLSSAASGTRTFTFLANGDVNVSGVIADGSATVNVSKSGSGTLALAGANTFTGTTTVSAGKLVMSGSTSSGGMTIGSTATLAGNGTINGPVTIQSGATLSPGTSIGALTINNTLALAGTTFMELNKTAGTNDTVRGLSSVTYGGTLSLTNLAGTLTGGETFKLFSASSYSGTFASLTPSSPGANLVWNTNSLATDGTLRVITTTTTNLTLNLAGSVLALSWPVDHFGWRLETNAVSLANSNAWFTLNGSTLTNQVFVTIDPAQTNVFFRLKFP
ncbi:MAG: hypothetical protein EPO07_12245 [Verrucomicrobia bacterium]|nr:MAG: hypothetical protein EPO07_12245 [Verrucomicrobiota bacterium]